MTLCSSVEVQQHFCEGDASIFIIYIYTVRSNEQEISSKLNSITHTTKDGAQLSHFCGSLNSKIIFDAVVASTEQNRFVLSIIICNCSMLVNFDPPNLSDTKFELCIQSSIACLRTVESVPIIYIVT
jgi:hypothetical protein